MDETFEVLTLLQTGRQTPIPVVMVENPETGYFGALAKFVESRLIGDELITPDETCLYRIAQTVEEACDEVFKFYRLYHSSRYVGEKLMIRLRRMLTKNELEQLNVSFADILRSGGIESGPVLPEEKDDAQLEALARIQLDFNRRSFGRLRQLIDAINNFG